MNTRAFQPMRRVAVRTMLFLLLGAIVNLMVAWGLAVFFPIHVAVTHQGVFSTAPTDPIQWQNAVIPQFGALGIDAEVWRYHRVFVIKGIPEWSLTRATPTATDFSQGRVIREMAYGLPMVAFFSRSDNRGAGGVKQELGIDLSSNQYEPPTLPYGPIWRGISVNTAVYAILGWIVSVIWISVDPQGRLRTRRGLCPACGTSPVCTECGAAVKPRKTFASTAG